jgi:hypothetical protein
MKTAYFLLILITAVAHASSPGGDEKGNGGGGTIHNGQVMTLGSAHLFVDPSPLQERDIPGLDKVLAVVKGLPLFYMMKDDFTNDLIPFGARKYYKVQSVDPAALKTLQEKYAKLARTDINSISIFAVTDTDKSVTYLMPSFYQLKLNEQAAILFHEARWLDVPWSKYEDVVREEVAFQRYLDAQDRGEYEPSFGVELAKHFGDYSISLKMDLDYDLKTGALAALGAGPEGLPARSLVAPEYLSSGCIYEKDEKGVDYCATFEFGHAPENAYLYSLAEKAPKSFFLKHLLDFMAPDERGRIGFLMFNVSDQTAEEGVTFRSDYYSDTIDSILDCHGDKPSDCTEFGFSDFEKKELDLDQGNRSITFITH